MGTSKGYGMPTGGAWTPLKNEASRFVKEIGGASSGSANPTHASPKRLLGRYLEAFGGSRKVASGRGGGTGGHVGRAAGRAGGKLGGFLSGVSSQGLAATLREIGLSGLVGKSAADVASGLLDAFTDPANTLDDEAVRTALSQLLSEMLESAKTPEEVETVFSEIINERGVSRILADFFGKYLYRIFIRDFYEGWQKRVGAAQANQKLREVKDYILSSIKSKFAGEESTKRNWSGNDGLRLSQEIMNETLFVFAIVQ